jgi:hypothetical protein
MIRVKFTCYKGGLRTYVILTGNERPLHRSEALALSSLLTLSKKIWAFFR